MNSDVTVASVYCGCDTFVCYCVFQAIMHNASNSVGLKKNE